MFTRKYLFRYEKARKIEPGYCNFSKTMTTLKFKLAQIKINLIYTLINFLKKVRTIQLYSTTSYIPMAKF